MKLNPSQLNVLEQLGAKPDERPVFSEDLQKLLKAELEDRGRELSSAIPSDESLFISKYH